MAEDEKRPTKSKQTKRSGPGGDRITVRRLPGRNVFELVHPQCARQRQEDMEEVHAMIKAGEVDIAVDELRWLLIDCHALLEAHQLLGQIALDEGNLELARGHLGYAFELGLQAVPKSGLSGTLAYARKPNQPFFHAARGLAECFQRLDKPHLAANVAQKLLALDPSDPLDVRGMLN